MELTKLPFPDVSNRSRVHRAYLRKGSVVAFKTLDGEERTGVIVMNNDHEMLVAYNLYKEPGNIWTEGILPNHVFLYEANEEEKMAGYLFFLEKYKNEAGGLAEGLIKFFYYEIYYNVIDHVYGFSDFAKDFLAHIPVLLTEGQRHKAIEYVTGKILGDGGAQFNRYQAENRCFLLAILRISEAIKDEEQYKAYIVTLCRNWFRIVVMYGICMGHVLGSNFTNIVGVLNNLKQSHYVGYLHLYLPIAERCIDKCCAHYDNKIKLQNAINTLNRLESDHEQKTDLDELYGVLFPIFFQEAMSKSRPAATTAELKQEIAELKKELAKNLEDFQSRYKELERSFEKLMKGSVSFDEIEKNVMELPTGIAVDLLSKLLLTFKGDPDKQDGINKIIAKVIDKANYEQHSTVYNYAPGATHMDYSKKISIETKDFNEPKLLNHE